MGDSKLLLAAFNDERKSSVEYGLSELSEGQRVLAVFTRPFAA